MAAYGHLGLPSASLVCLGLATAYVSAIYVFDRGHAPSTHPSSIRRRMAGVAVASLGAGAGAAMLARVDARDAMRVLGLGIEPLTLGNVVRPLLANMVLFAGPLLQALLDGQGGSPKYSRNKRFGPIVERGTGGERGREKQKSRTGEEWGLSSWALGRLIPRFYHGSVDQGLPRAVV